MQIAARHWVIALSLAVVVHAAIAAAILWVPPSSGAESDGRGGIEVLLSPEGGLPGKAATAVSELTEAEPVEVADDLSEAPLEPESAMHDPVLEDAEPVSEPAEAQVQPMPPVEDAVPVDDASEVAEIDQLAEAQALPSEEMEAAEIRSPPEAVPAPSQPVEVAEAVALVEAEPVQQELSEHATQAEQPTTTVAAVEPTEEIAARTVVTPPVPRQKPPVPKRAKAKATSAAEAAPQRSSAGTSAGTVTASRGQILDYAAKVRARIASRRQATARARGKVVVSFAIAADGSLRYARVSRSSGQAVLDRAAMSAVQRSSPFPRPPQGMTAQDLTYAVPFEFR